MPEHLKRLLRLIAAAVSIILILTIIRFGWIQFKDASSLHRHWQLIWIAAAVVSQLCVYICIAGMFSLSLSSSSVKLTPLFLIYCAFAFLFANRSLPGPAIAGVATLVYLMRRKGIASVDAQAAAGAFYFADYSGFFTLIAMVCVPLLLIQHNDTIRDLYVVGLAIIVITAGAAIILFYRPGPAVRSLSQSVNAIRLIIFPKKADNLWGEAIEHLLLQLHGRMMCAVKTPGRIFSFYFLSVVMHAAEVATVIFAGRAAGISLAAPIAAVAYVAGNLASIISVLPGAVGFYEAGMIGTLHLAGHLSLGDSAVCALTYRILSFWAPLPVVVNVLVRVSRDSLKTSSKGPSPTSGL